MFSNLLQLKAGNYSADRGKSTTVTVRWWTELACQAAGDRAPSPRACALRRTTGSCQCISVRAPEHQQLVSGTLAERERGGRASPPHTAPESHFGAHLPEPGECAARGHREAGPGWFQAQLLFTGTSFRSTPSDANALIRLLIPPPWAQLTPLAQESTKSRGLNNLKE